MKYRSHKTLCVLRRVGLVGWLLLAGLLVAGRGVGPAQEANSAPSYSRTISATLANPQFKHVLACGHRGAPLHAPENTLASFEKALQFGADIIEIDVRSTRDGHFVIFHDDTVTRLTGQPGTIEDRTLAEVRQLEIQMAEFPNVPKQTILTLAEAMNSLRGRAIVYLDHKTGPVSRLADEIVRLRATDNAYLVVRTPQAAREARAVSPKLHLMAAITAEEPASLIELFLPAGPTLFELPTVYLTPENVNRLRVLGIRIFTNALTLEELRPYTTFQYLLYRGADVIQTDRLDRLVPYLRAFNATRSAGGAEGKLGASAAVR